MISLFAAFSFGVAAAFATPSHSETKTQAGISRNFKVVKPPSAGARQRLTINRSGAGLPHAVRPPGARRKPEAKAQAQTQSWFWDAASPGLAAADVARLSPLASLAATRLRKADGDALVSRIAATYRREILAAARAMKVSEALLIAVIAAESGGNPKARSKAGAQGLAQLMPATARRFAVTDPFDPAQNLLGSAAYLSTLLGLFDDDPVLALAGYNAGENAVLRHKGVPPYKETRKYVPTVLAYYDKARRLCETEPDGPRARCSFTETR